MSNSLIIISEPIDANSIFKNFKGEFDILALTPIAMLSLDKLKIPYCVTGHFYNDDIYRTDIKNVINKVDSLLNNLDQLCNNYFEFPFAYSGNSNYLLHELLDLYFIDKLCEKIKNKYNKIYLISNKTDRMKLWDKLSYSDLKSHPNSETVSINLTAGIESKLQIIKDILDVKIIKQKILKHKQVPYYIRLNQTLKKFKSFSIKGSDYIKRCIKNKQIPLYEKYLRDENNIHLNNNMKKNIFIIQDNYEVASLKKYLNNYNLINPVSALRKRVPVFKPNNYNFEKVEKILNPFLKNNYKLVTKHIFSMFKSYHREVVGRLSYYIDESEKIINKYNPHIYLCSCGTRDVIDCLINSQANKHKIPVIYFQHGGTLLFFNDEFQKYVGSDTKIKKTLILHSQLEVKELMHKGSKFLPFGSINKFHLLKNNSLKKMKNKAIYCTAPFPNQNYRTLSTGYGDKVYYNSSREIIMAARNKLIRMDIKPHPINFLSQFDYYSNLININKYNYGRLIPNIAAEKLLQSYNLIIIDFLGSALIPYILSLRVPVILYLKDRKIVNKISSDDLIKRCYIAEDYNELEELFHLYSQKKLPSKWTIEIIDRYVYPTSNGDPGQNIADYISNI